MGFRDRLLAWLNRGDPGDPDELVEVTVVPLHQGPLAVASLRHEGIKATLVEGWNPVTDVRSDARIMVRRADAQRALEVLATDLR